MFAGFLFRFLRFSFLELMRGPAKTVTLIEFYCFRYIIVPLLIINSLVTFFVDSQNLYSMAQDIST